MYIYESGLNVKRFLNIKSEYTENYLRELYTEYERLKDAPVPQLTREDFDEYARTGRRVGYERKYFARRTMLRDFALMTLLGRGEAVGRLEKIITAVCAERTWTLPAHASEDENAVDLFAAETAQSLTEIVSLTRGKLKTDVAEQAISEVKRRVLTPYLTRREPYNWENARSNWCAVCGGCVGMTALYLIEDADDAREAVSGLESVFESYAESFSDDGACLEGLYYWGYGMTYLTAFLELYRERAGADFPVNTEKLAKMAAFAGKCAVKDGITVSFSDDFERGRIYSGLSSSLTERFGAPPVPSEYLAPFSGDDCGRWCRAVRDIAWYSASEGGETETVSVMNGAQWAVMRGNTLSLAFKGGTNGEPHNHNDIGSFTVVKNGDVILCDLGAGEYTREYFSDDRYGVFCCSSFGHSVPIVDGAPQLAGVEYAAKDFKINGTTVSADISGAYGIRALKKCVRTLTLNKNNIRLTDKFTTDEPVKITERFITRLDARETADGIVVGSALLKADGAHDVKISHVKHAEHGGKETDVTVIDFTFEVQGEGTFTLAIE